MLKGIQQEIGGPRAPETRPGGNVVGDVSALLATFGVKPLDQQESLERVLGEALRRRGHQAQVISIRHGRVTLRATGGAAALLSYDLEILRDELNAILPGAVEEIRVRVVREGRA